MTTTPNTPDTSTFRPLPPKSLAAHLAGLVAARANCIRSGNDEWLGRHTDRARGAVDDLCPSGSGIDNGSKLDLERSTDSKLVFTVEYHHMDENGYYCGWRTYTVVVTPAFEGIVVSVTGRGDADTKDYLADVYRTALQERYTETMDGYAPTTEGGAM